jgi:preprotein translocase subunit YajC
MLMAAQTTQTSPLVTLFPLLLLGFVFYFLLIRPQQKRSRQQQALIRSVEVGDEVVTGGGILGHVVEIDEDEGIVTLEIADGVEIRILRAGIGRKIETDEYEDDDDEDADDEDADDEHEAATAGSTEDHNPDGHHPGAGNVVSDDQPEQTKEL